MWKRFTTSDATSGGDDDVDSEPDYDEGLTELYTLIESKKWDEALQQIEISPDETTIWVYRKERNSDKIRWRLLPIHAAIVFKAPKKIIESLLIKNPQGAQSKDDQGALPLHIAIRNKCAESIVILLLMAYPKSIEMRDRKNRLPIILAQSLPKGALRESYMTALQNAPSYFRITQASIASTAIQSIAQKAEAERLKLTETIKTLEIDLARAKEHGVIVNNQLKQLESQLKSSTDTELFLKTKVAILDTNVQDLTQSKDIQETEFMVRNEKVQKEKADVEDFAKTLMEEISNLRVTVSKQDAVISTNTVVKDRMEAEIRSLKKSRFQSADKNTKLKKKFKDEQLSAEARFCSFLDIGGL